MQGTQFRATRFARSARTYESEAHVQRLLAARCAAACSRESSRVLEFGCGTGMLTRALRRRLPDSLIVATDSVPAMLHYAREHGSAEGVRFALQEANGESAPCARVVRHAPYDLVASSALLQWLPDLSAHLCFAARLVRPGSTYAFSAFTRENLPELNRILAEPPLSYASFPGVVPEQIEAIARASGWILCALQEAEDRETLRTPLAALHHLRAMGASRDPREGGRLTRATLDRLLVTYAERHSVVGGVSLTWRSCTALLVRAR